MELMLDADALIKLNRAGVLSLVARAYQCAIPQEVYHEVIIHGKERGYADAEAIETIVKDSITVLTTGGLSKPEGSLGVGETTILALIEQGYVNTIIVSDDRRFLARLELQNRAAITPANLLVALVRRGNLPLESAKDALERLRPGINPNIYQQAINDLEATNDYQEQGNNPACTGGTGRAYQPIQSG